MLSCICLVDMTRVSLASVSLWGVSLSSVLNGAMLFPPGAVVGSLLRSHGSSLASPPLNEVNIVL